MARRRLIGGLVLSFCLAAGLAACGWRETFYAGRDSYVQSCAPCHGLTGAGDGKLSAHLTPKPRDFRLGLFKIRSALDFPPTDADLRRVIEYGMPGSAMPSSKGRLTEQEISSVISYIKTFTPTAFADAPTRLVLQGDPPQPNPKRLAAGKQIYREMRCGRCHGDGGAGDGPSSAALKDDLGEHLAPADFTAGLFKGGDDPRDIYARVTTGMLGTPMPAYGEFLTDTERWDIALYVKSLAMEPAVHDEPQTIVAAMTGRVTDNPYDRVWAELPPAQVALRPLRQRARFPRSVEVRAAYDGKHLAVHLVWFDSTRDTGQTMAGTFPDAAAAQFPLSDDPAFFGMGAVILPSNIWHWKADLQEARREGEADRGSPCVEYNAEGPGRIRLQPREFQSVTGNGYWRGGVWTVVLVHELNSGEDEDAAFTMGDDRPVAFAIWDGGAGDLAGRKVVSQIHRIKMRP